ncbi:MAG TPA: phospholipase D family protein [Steroidobacteraceae bacterium]
MSESQAIAVGQSAPLDRLFETERQMHPDQSGAYLVGLGIDAFAFRALSARAAERSLDLQYYIWHGDATGRYLANELLSAADRGVRVRVLLDDLDARSRDDVLMALAQHSNIEIRLFNPFATSPGFLRTMGEMFSRGATINHRMHNKAWIADGRIALVGGRNIGDEYFAASSGMNFIDLDVLLAGPVVAQTEQVFDRYWNSGIAVPIEHLKRTDGGNLGLAEARSMLAEAVDEERGSDYAQRLRESPELAGLINRESALTWSAELHIVADDPRKAQPQYSGVIDPGVLQSLVGAFGTAQSELWLISPYFVPGEEGTAALTKLAGSGVNVRVITNSLAGSDVAAVHSGYARYRKALLKGGVRLYELKPSPGGNDSDAKMRLGSSHAGLHTKAVVVDRKRIFVGSFNLDPRSATLNCEMGAWMGATPLVDTLHDLFDAAANPQLTFVVSLDEKDELLWTEELDGRVVQHHTDPHASWGRRAAVWLLSLLPIESQL